MKFELDHVAGIERDTVVAMPVGEPPPAFFHLRAMAAVHRQVHGLARVFLQIGKHLAHAAIELLDASGRCRRTRRASRSGRPNISIGPYARRGKDGSPPPATRAICRAVLPSASARTLRPCSPAGFGIPAKSQSVGISVQAARNQVTGDPRRPLWSRLSSSRCRECAWPLRRALLYAPAGAMRPGRHDRWS